MRVFSSYRLVYDSDTDSTGYHWLRSDVYKRVYGHEFWMRLNDIV